MATRVRVSSLRSTARRCSSHGTRHLILQLLALLARATATATASCGNAALTTQHTLNTPDGRSRFYLKYKPSGVMVASNYPLVIELHGLSACASHLYGFSGWKGVADRNNFILVTPQGESRSWNAGRCCGDSRESQLNVDDVSFLRTVATQVLAAEPGVDPTCLLYWPLHWMHDGAADGDRGLGPRGRGCVPRGHPDGAALVSSV